VIEFLTGLVMGLGVGGFGGLVLLELYDPELPPPPRRRTDDGGPTNDRGGLRLW
jgi:hypothetical protein